MKLEKIRTATPEEVAQIAAESDLTPMSQVLKMGDSSAVWRIANELDPFHFGPETSNSQKYMFLWGLQNMLRGTGATEIYFNVAVANGQFRQIVEHLGAVATSKEPELRYKITL
jgi:hypothetical protein